MQWKLSILDTIGTQLAVLYREVPLIQRLICTQLYVCDCVTYNTLQVPLEVETGFVLRPKHDVLVKYEPRKWST